MRPCCACWSRMSSSRGSTTTTTTTTRSTSSLQRKLSVFFVVGPSTSRFETAASDLMTCLASYRYQMFVVTSQSDRKQYDDVIIARTAARLCIAAGATSVVAWRVDVAGPVVSPSLVADLVTEAYVDNVTWYDVVFLAGGGGTTSSSSFPAARSRWPPPPDEARPPLYGRVWVDDERGRVAFHRTHLDVFGDGWPHWMQTGSEVASYLKDVYAADISSPPSSTFDDAVREDRAWLRRQVPPTSTGLL